MSDIDSVLASIVTIGDAPAPRTIELGEAVAQSIKSHPANPPIERADDSQLSNVVAALFDARNAIDAALAHLTGIK